jgi:hypothetical protein
MYGWQCHTYINLGQSTVAAGTIAGGIIIVCTSIDRSDRWRLCERRGGIGENNIRASSSVVGSDSAIALLGNRNGAIGMFEWVAAGVGREVGELLPPRGECSGDGGGEF